MTILKLKCGHNVRKYYKSSEKIVDQFLKWSFEYGLEWLKKLEENLVLELINIVLPYFC